MLKLNLRDISHSTLNFSNLLGRTYLKKHVDWSSTTHQYAEKNGVKLTCDVYSPQTQGLRPAILVVHGGGWCSRTREDTAFYAEQLAGQGFVVVNCTYRLAPDHIYPCAVEDVRDAYYWMIKMADTFRIDPKNIGAIGYSAGGHLLSLVAAWASQERDGYADVKFKALVSGGGVYDFMVYPESPYINRFTTFYRDQNTELYQNASPLHQLGDALPKFFLFHAENDKLVEIDQMMRFKKAIKKRGGEVETYIVPNLSHNFTFVFSVKSLELSIDFFKRQLSSY